MIEIVLIGIISMLMPIAKFGIEEIGTIRKTIYSQRRLPPGVSKVKTPTGGSGQARAAMKPPPESARSRYYEDKKDQPMPTPPKGGGGVVTQNNIDPMNFGYPIRRAPRVKIRPDERLKRKGY